MKIISLSENLAELNPTKGKDPTGDGNLTKRVADILATVEKEGRKACLDYTRQFDQVTLTREQLCLRPAKIQLKTELPKDFEQAVQHAIENVTAFHARQQPLGYALRSDEDCHLGEQWIPLDRVGCYIPGGSAPLVSTLLMTVIPAKLAGVPEIVVCTPPDSEGFLHEAMLRVCQLLEVSEVLLCGGAQGIAALAYGLEDFRPVDKIVGPGNRYVTEAKRLVFGTVDIDMLAGPSEVCILADRAAPPAFIAADLLSQLEHDANAQAVCIATDQLLLQDVIQLLQQQLKELPRRAIIEEALSGLHFYLAKDVEQAIAAADKIAPEHLEVMFEDALRYKDRPWKSGAVFLGHYAPVALGDFYGGTNHVLPTDRRSAFSSPLSVYDFFRRSQYVYYSRRQMQKVHADIEALASMEGLDAHRRSVSLRVDPEALG